MDLENGWLKCKITEGMLPMEYAVSCNTIDGNVISFFASEEYIDSQNNLVQVGVMECKNDSCLIYVPSDPLEGVSRTVIVSTNDMVDM